ncbi:MAG: hypothetical protein C0404_10195 [Verrucomicrobia bacterium]|nr:hypothetical protein [Verrucomicrobiota bacterium]
MARLTCQTRDMSPAATSLNSSQIKRARSCLLRWGRRNFKDYPWRSENDPWLTLAAEFMLQRTRAVQVVPVFNEFRARFPTAECLVAAGLVAIREITGRLGLHRRGPQLVELARQVAACGGTPPEVTHELKRFSGVGMYTAAAWLSLHRGKRAVIIDANVARWLSRMTGLPYNRDPRHVRWVQDLAEQLTPRRAYRDYNYAVLDFTMAICTPRHPVCATCPLHAECRFFRDAASIELPPATSARRSHRGHRQARPNAST